MCRTAFVQPTLKGVEQFLFGLLSARIARVPSPPCLPFPAESSQRVRKRTQRHSTNCARLDSQQTHPACDALRVTHAQPQPIPQPGTCMVAESRQLCLDSPVSMVFAFLSLITGACFQPDPQPDPQPCVGCSLLSSISQAR